MHLLLVALIPMVISAGACLLLGKVLERRMRILVLFLGGALSLILASLFFPPVNILVGSFFVTYRIIRRTRGLWWSEAVAGFLGVLDGVLRWKELWLPELGLFWTVFFLTTDEGDRWLRRTIARAQSSLTDIARAAFRRDAHIARASS
jgi:hypothetical protein